MQHSTPVDDITHLAILTTEIFIFYNPFSSINFIYIFSATFLLYVLCLFIPSRESSVGIETGYGFDSRQGNNFFSIPQRPDRLWGLPSPLSNGHMRSYFLEVKVAGS
jgi:hypothetical protein